MNTIEEFFKNRVSFTPNLNHPFPNFSVKKCLTQKITVLIF